MIFDSRELLYLTTIYNKQDAKIYTNMSLFTLIVVICLLPDVVSYNQFSVALILHSIKV